MSSDYPKYFISLIDPDMAYAVQESAAEEYSFVDFDGFTSQILFSRPANWIHCSEKLALCMLGYLDDLDDLDDSDDEFYDCESRFQFITRVPGGEIYFLPDEEFTVEEISEECNDSQSLTGNCSAPTFPNTTNTTNSSGSTASYRPLMTGETLQPDDEFLVLGVWQKTEFPGFIVPTTQSSRYRRPLISASLEPASPEPGHRYRLLSLGEEVEKGDQFWDSERCAWEDVALFYGARIVPEWMIDFRSPSSLWVRRLFHSFQSV